MKSIALLSLAAVGLFASSIGCSGAPATTPPVPPAPKVASTTIVGHPILRPEHSWLGRTALTSPKAPAAPRERLTPLFTGPGARANFRADPGDPQPAGAVLWSEAEGGNGDQSALAVATDLAGNPILAGYFSGQLDLGCGAMTALGSYDAFVAKLDASGACVWSTLMGAGSQNAAATGIAVDGNGDAYVVGTFDGPMDFGTGTLTPAGGLDGVIVKLSGSSGSTLWSAKLGGVSDDYVYGVAVSATRVAVSGTFYGTANFGGADVTSNGDGDAFLASYDTSSGAHVWSRGFGGAGFDDGNGAAFDSQGNVVLVGAFETSIDFGGGPLAGAGSDDAFVATFDPSGTHLHSAVYGGAGLDSATAVVVDSADNVVVGGYFGRSIDLGGGALTSGARFAGFLAKYDSSGAYVWAHALDSTFAVVPQSMTRDTADGVVFTGYYDGTATFGSHVTALGSVPTIFVAKYDAAGTDQWVTTFAVSDASYGYGVSASSGSVYVSGSFGTSIDFGAGPVGGAGTSNIPIAALVTN